MMLVEADGFGHICWLPLMGALSLARWSYVDFVRGNRIDKPRECGVRENAWNNFMAAGRTARRNHIALRFQYPLVRHPSPNADGMSAMQRFEPLQCTTSSALTWLWTSEG
jgi:hypothetical protein